MIIAAIALGVAAPPAGSLDWKRPADFALMVEALSRTTDFCRENFGFTRVPGAPTDLAAKARAHLLLSPSADYVIEKWTAILRDVHAPYNASKDKAFIDRLTDALEAAVQDPSRKSEAQALHAEVYLGPWRRALQGCRSAAADDFLGKSLLSGEGSLDKVTLGLNEHFERSVAEIAQYKADIEKKAKR